MNEEVEDLEDQKKELENELKLRNEEIYQLNEKIILLEINNSSTINVNELK